MADQPTSRYETLKPYMEDIAKSLDALLPLCSRPQEMSVQDFTLYIKLAEAFYPMRNMLEELMRSEIERTVTVPFETARLIRTACLPLNPNKCRNWHPDLLAAVRSFIAAVEAADVTKR